MSSQESRNSSPWLHRFAVLTVCATFFLIIAGGLVTSTDSGLAVPDWPLSYGQIMPPMVGGIFYEHGHRMVATAVGMLTVILAFWLWRKDGRRWARNLGWIALATVITQGVIGGITVLTLLPPPVSVAHATLAQSFFCLVIFIAMITSGRWGDPAVEMESITRTRKLALAVTAVIFLQLVLGAVMRHTYSGLAIPDFPLSYGHWLPPLDPGTMPSINQMRIWDDLAPVEFNQIWIHFAHRIGALLVTVVLLANAWHVLTTYRKESRLREPAIVLLTLLVFQILLGVLTVWTGKHVEVATAHVATGALMLGFSVVLVVRSYRFYTATETATELSFAAEATRS